MNARIISNSINEQNIGLLYIILLNFK